MNARSTVKALLEHALVWTGVAALHRRRMAGRTLILAYHNVVRDDQPPAGDLGNHLPLSKFLAQMTALCETHDVVPLADALTPSSTRSRPRVAITFDDAYRGAVVNAIPELVRLGLPATFFVAPQFVGGGSFWWDVLAGPGGGLDPQLREHALDELRGEDAAVRDHAQRTGHAIVELRPELRVATEQELIHGALQPGITLGSHTWGHPNLTRLRPDELAREMTQPLAWLRERIAKPLPWIAYPYGYFNSTVERAAADAGYAAALAVSGGWMGTTAPGNRFALPRLNIPPGLTARGFSLRGAGLLAG